MSRNYTRNARGRPPTLGLTPKFTKTKENPSETYQRQPNGRKSKPLQRNAVTNRMKNNKRKRADSTTEEELSSLDGSDTADDASDEDSEEDADDEDDLPAVPAPSRSHRLNEAGRSSHSLPMDNVSIAGSIDSMFGDYENYFDEDDDPRLSPEENRKRFENKVFADSDDDNDDLYQAVDDISDSDGDFDNDRLQEQELLAMISEEDNSEADDLLNQIDGLSAYGFGDDSDASIHRLASSQGSDSANETITERRVHFAMEGDHSSMFMRLSESPTMTRALLPSALPDNGLSPHVDKRMLGDELEDSDLTDDCLPEQAHHSPSNNAESDKEMSPSVSPPSKKASKKTPRRRGPPRGIFIDDGEKPSGILDPSGKIILMTNPHLLGDEFARRYGASQTSSPDVGFAELIEESDAGDLMTDMVAGPAADIMLASLNSAMNDPSNLGQPIGPLEAFYPSNSILLGDYVLDPDDLEENFRPDDDLGEDVINLDDVIQFDEETDDESMPTSPIYMPPNNALPSFANMNNGLAHLNNNNVTAFRRNADPAYAAFSNTPSFHDMELFSSPFSTPAPRRKRKHLSSPYTSSHYKGVTPVQRVRDPNHAQTPDPVTPAKRRRLMT